MPSVNANSSLTHCEIKTCKNFKQGREFLNMGVALKILTRGMCVSLEAKTAAES